MKVKLTVKQRLNLQSILPQQGDFLTVKMIRVLREELSFSQEEHELLKLVSNRDGSVSWDAKVAEDCIKEVEIPETVVSTIKQTLEKLNAQKKITDAHLDFYEMFMDLGNSDKG
jgi:hypothetical protein